MQDDVDERTITFGFRAGKVTAQMLVKAMKIFLAQNKTGMNKSKDVKSEPGKISMRKLMEQSGGNISNIEVTDKNIKSFDRVARKYGITYSLKKAADGRHYVFFKAGSVDAMTAAFKEYTRKQTRKASRPSVLTELRKLVEQVKNMAISKTKNKNRGQEL